MLSNRITCYREIVPEKEKKKSVSEANFIIVLF